MCSTQVVNFHLTKRWTRTRHLQGPAWRKVGHFPCNLTPMDDALLRPTLKWREREGGGKVTSFFCRFPFRDRRGGRRWSDAMAAGGRGVGKMVVWLREFHNELTLQTPHRHFFCNPSWSQTGKYACDNFHINSPTSVEICEGPSNWQIMRIQRRRRRGLWEAGSPTERTRVQFQSEKILFVYAALPPSVARVLPRPVVFVGRVLPHPAYFWRLGSPDASKLDHYNM